MLRTAPEASPFSLVTTFNGTVRPSAWEWFHWIGLKKSLTAIGFDFLILVLNFLSSFIHKLIKPPATKMLESQQLFFGLRLVSRIFKEFQHPTRPQSKQNSAALWRIFSTNKSAPAIRKKGFYTNRDPNKQEVGFIKVWNGSELWSLFKYSKLKLKN